VPVERALDAEQARSRADLERRRIEATEEALRIRRVGEEALSDEVLGAEAAALREALDEARDRVSRTRRETERWIDETERRAAALLERAVDLVTGGGAPGAGTP
jgi:hypothetical protein